MNSKGVMSFGVFMALVLVLFIVYVSLAAFVEPFKSTLDTTRGSSSLNCPNTPNFNQTAYDAQDIHDKLRMRTTCFATGMIMVYFILSVILAWLVWIFKKVIGL